MAFFGEFRPSEFFARGKADASARALQIQDLTWVSGRVDLTIRQSKTNQRGIGCQVFLKEAARMPLYPVRALQEYVGKSGA